LDLADLEIIELSLLKEEHLVIQWVIIIVHDKHLLLLILGSLLQIKLNGIHLDALSLVQIGGSCGLGVVCDVVDVELLVYDHGVRCELEELLEVLVSYHLVVEYLLNYLSLVTIKLVYSQFI
jgi:hypothetical protein